MSNEYEHLDIGEEDTYFVAETSTERTLKLMVNHLMNEGWRPTGGVQFIPPEHWFGESKLGAWVQAMYRMPKSELSISQRLEMIHENVSQIEWNSRT